MQQPDITDLSPEVKYSIVQQIGARLQGIGGHKNGESQVLMGRPVSTEGQWIQKHGRGRIIVITIMIGLALTLLSFGASAGSLVYWDKVIKKEENHDNHIAIFIISIMLMATGIFTFIATTIKVRRLCKTPSHVQLIDTKA